MRQVQNISVSAWRADISSTRRHHSPARSRSRTRWQVSIRWQQIVSAMCREVTSPATAAVVASSSRRIPSAMSPSATNVSPSSATQTIS
jgi:hypothetical protein